MKLFVLILSLFCCHLLIGQNEATDEEIFVLVEQMPEFPGGQDAMLEFLYNNIKYPEKAKKKGIEGLVVINFLIMEDGTLAKAEVKRDIGGGCGAEAVRVVKTMPKWEPGMHRGEPVIVSYNLPVRFKLQDNTKKKKKKKSLWKEDTKWRPKG